MLTLTLPPGKGSKDGIWEAFYQISILSQHEGALETLALRPLCIFRLQGGSQPRPPPQPVQAEDVGMGAAAPGPRGRNRQGQSLYRWGALTESKRGDPGLRGPLLSRAVLPTPRL